MKTAEPSAKTPFGWFRDRLKRIARVSAYFAVVTLVLGMFATRRVYGSLTQTGLEIGSGLAQVGELVGPSYQVLLNGQMVNVSTATTDRPMEQVLDRFAAECREHSGGLGGELQALSATLHGDQTPSTEGAPALSAIRTIEKDRGMVVCLARDEALGYGGKLQALRSFAHSGDLLDLGKLRYILAERTHTGRTHVVAAWTEGSFHIGGLFPRSGDAPGSDLPETFRPAEARRLLSAGVADAPFGVRIYEVPGKRDEVLAKYSEGMLTLGWQSIPRADHDGERLFMRGPADLVVTAQPSKNGDATMVSLVSMPPRIHGSVY